MNDSLLMCRLPDDETIISFVCFFSANTVPIKVVGFGLWREVIFLHLYQRASTPPFFRKSIFRSYPFYPIPSRYHRMTVEGQGSTDIASISYKAFLAPPY